MSDETRLGELAPEGAGRDAVHIAVLPIMAGENLGPGDKVRILDGRAFGWSTGEGYVGVVDPYLDQIVGTGQTFFLFVRPRTITGLRHVWTHPDFPEEVSSSPSGVRGYSNAMRVVTDAAHQLEMDPSALIREAEQAIRVGAPIYLGTETCYLDAGLVWDALEHVLGRQHPDPEMRYFRCAC